MITYRGINIKVDLDKKNTKYNSRGKNIHNVEQDCSYFDELPFKF